MVREISECIRCGTCCKKGGPAFHIEDREIIEKGIIQSRYLFTIRSGEPSYDNIKNRILPAKTDIIKIKGKNNSPACFFFNESEKICKIYESRPIECKALKCWDTSEIESIYSQNRLTRKDILSTVSGLWELIEDHQRRCSYMKIMKIIEATNQDMENLSFEGIVDIINYDVHLRKLVVEKVNIDPEILDFLFGRLLSKTIRNIYM